MPATLTAPTAESAAASTRPVFEWNSLRVERAGGFALELGPGSIAPGSITFVVGRNGSGKSTFLQLLAGQFEGAWEGDLCCLGRPQREWATRAYAREVSYLAQEHGGAPPDLAVIEVVRLGRFAHGYGPGDGDLVFDCLQQVGLTELAYRPFNELSGGERQRVWLAMALAQQTNTILLDEPTTFLDWQRQLELLSLLAKLNRERGVTIVAVLHDLNLALATTAHWLVLNQGQLVHHGEPLNFLRRENLHEVFGVQARLVENAGRNVLVAETPTMIAHTDSFAATSTPRCPVRAPAEPAPAESLFVEHAAADLAGSELHAGDPEADALLAGARAMIYYWPTTFNGFCGRLTVREGDREWVGGIHVQSSRKYTIELEGYPNLKWLKFQLEELVAHREATSVSHIASKAGVVFGDHDAVYGRRVDFVGDKMQSFYRIQDQRLTQIGRGYGKQRFIINIDEHQDCAGLFAARNYTAFYYDSASGRLIKTETYLDRYAPQQGLFLPVERRFSEATDNGLHSRQILLSDLHVLPAKTTTV